MTCAPGIAVLSLKPLKHRSLDLTDEPVTAYEWTWGTLQKARFADLFFYIVVLRIILIRSSSVRRRSPLLGALPS
jgi:hypothetical protein